MPYKYTNDTRNMLEGYFNGQTPLERKKPAFGESKNYFIDPNDSTQTIEVPDGTDPYTFRDAGYKAPDTTMSLQPITTSSTTTLSFPFEGQETQENNDDRFNNIFNNTLTEEGGYEADLNRIDQPTNRGITDGILRKLHRTVNGFSDRYPQDIKDLTLEQTREIARDNYYTPYRVNEINNDRVAQATFDMHYMSSPQAVANTLQRSLNDLGKNVSVDGVMGSQTINAINTIQSDEEQTRLLERIRQNRLDYLNSLPQSSRYPGWINRTNRY